MSDFTVKTLNNRGAFPDSSFVPASEALPEALALNTSIVSLGPTLDGDGPTVQIPYVSADPTASFVAEAQAITESEAALSQLSVNTHKIGLLTSLSSEAFGYSDAASLITDSARRAVTAKADFALLSNPATAGEPTGLALIDGIQTAAGTDFATDGLTPILTMLATVADHGATPTSLVMRFATWARLLGLTATDGRPLIQPDVASATAPVIYGVPVVISPFAPENSVMVLDATQIMCSWSDIKVATSTDALFGQDAVALRLTARIGFGVIHPDRLGIVTLATATAPAGK